MQRIEVNVQTGEQTVHDWTPPPPPPFDQAAAMQRLRTLRAPILNALAGIGFDALASGDTATTDAVQAARQGLKDLPEWPAVLAATDDESFDDAVMARYRELVAAAPDAVRVAFRGLT